MTLIFERFSRNITRLCDCEWKHVTDPETRRIAGWRVTEFDRHCPVTGHKAAAKAAYKAQLSSAPRRAA